MKKIIELAEHICRAANPITRIALNIDRLEKELIKRKTLEQTPITEDWLKEHGFIVVKSELSGGVIVSHFQKGQYEEGGEIRVFVENEHTMQIRKRIHGGGFINVIIPHHSLADLYDALELCGITMN